MKSFIHYKQLSYKSQHGMALITTLAVITLASLLVYSLSFSYSLKSTEIVSFERTIKSEYLLKSSLNLARGILKADTTATDSKEDFWAQFLLGRDIPPDLINLQQKGVRLSLEIAPVDNRIRLSSLTSSEGKIVNKQWRDVLVRLFKNLGFDQDNQEDKNFGGQIFNSEQMVANLIDYLDSDKESYEDESFARGIESNLKENFFPNNGQIYSTQELLLIPGFTPTRVKKISFYTIADKGGRININFAPREVLLALDENMTNSIVDLIVSFRESENGPFARSNEAKDNENWTTKIKEFLGTSGTKLTTLLNVESRWFEVICKVSFQTGGNHYLRAYVYRTAKNTLPIVRSLEIFG